MRAEFFGVDQRGRLARAVVPERGRPYRHSCPGPVLEAIAHAADESPEGFTLEQAVARENAPFTAAAVALAFLKERGAVLVAQRRCFPAIEGGTHLDALVEFTSLGGTT